MKALLEQPNGLARRVVSKAGGNPTALLDATDAFIRRQPRVSGDSSQVRLHLFLPLAEPWPPESSMVPPNFLFWGAIECSVLA